MSIRQRRGFGGRRVLVVEDESRLRDMLVRAIREMGFEPAGAPTAEHATRLMEQQWHPVVVVDLNLPGASGMDFLRNARQRWPQTQAVILTGFGDLESARAAIHLDVADFLTKPCGLGDMEIALDRAFERLRALAPEGLDPELEPPDETDAHDDDEEVQGDDNPADEAEADAAAAATMAVADRGGAHGMTFQPRDGSAALSMEDVERQAILAALEKHHHNRAAAAAELGISLRKLYYRLAQYQKQGLPIA
ncbi:MAG TPA: response regulator [Tepidisphaeraceae bacterium]|jgi:DNA-binding NtrC family response regulator